MISRFLSTSCSSLALSQTYRATRNVFTYGNASTPSITKLLGNNGSKTHQSAVQLGRYRSHLSAVSFSLTRLCSTHSTKVFFTPPKPFGKGRDVLSDHHTHDKTLVDVDVDKYDKQLVVSWEDGDRQIFPFVWLRDNCRCPKCFHPVALGRLTYAHELNVNITANLAEISSDGGSLIIQWEDGHESQFPSNWLREYRFDKSPDDQYLNPKPHFWGADIDLQKFDFSELLNDDGALNDWLVELMTRGIAIVKNTPSEVGQLHRIGQRIAYLRTTNYGKTFQVETKVTPSNAAYTSGALAMHTDLAYYIREPGIQMLHCIEQAECAGGENLCSDGIKVATDLKQADPEAFRLLTTNQFEYFDVGKDHYGDFYQYARHPTIKLDDRGEIESVSISDHSRDPMLRAPVHQVQPLYRALHKYCNMLADPKNVLRYKLQKGDILTFNNRRVLHGRSSFQMTEATSRHLEGGYLEWDEVNSRMRVLAKQLRNQTK